ncbi:DUF1761 domain-containing protein [Candidatus Woesearchaeota archaeon]|nr:MAG: DUF1761 domain-containing protein [Candidatus Woesearchaeota archaeon]
MLLFSWCPSRRMKPLAILVASLAGFATEVLWYSPLLFRKPWMRAVGWTDEAFRKAREEGVAFSLFLSFLLSVITATVLNWLLDTLEMSTVKEGMMLAALLWLGFIATTYLDRVLWEGRSVSLYALTASHYLLALLAMGAIIGAWA